MTLVAEKPGTYYLPATHLVNIRAQKEFVIKDTLRLHLMFNVFNFVGNDTVTGVNQNTGPVLWLPDEPEWAEPSSASARASHSDHANPPSLFELWRASVCTTVVLLLLSALLCAQVKVGVLLINVVATVVDGKGRTVPNLTIDDFIVEEDGQPQTIKHLSPTADLPISIGVILDASGSMQSKIRTAQRAVDRFFSMIHQGR